MLLPPEEFLSRVPWLRKVPELSYSQVKSICGNGQCLNMWQRADALPPLLEEEEAAGKDVTFASQPPSSVQSKRSKAQKTSNKEEDQEEETATKY